MNIYPKTLFTHLQQSFCNAPIAKLILPGLIHKITGTLYLFVVVLYGHVRPDRSYAKHPAGRWSLWASGYNLNFVALKAQCWGYTDGIVELKKAKDKIRARCGVFRICLSLRGVTFITWSLHYRTQIQPINTWLSNMNLAKTIVKTSKSNVNDKCL